MIRKEPRKVEKMQLFFHHFNSKKLILKNPYNFLKMLSQNIMIN